MRRRQFLQTVATGCAAGFVSSTIVHPPRLAADAVAPVSSNRNRVVRFAHLTDIHLYSQRSAALGLATALRHLQSIEDRPEFIINGGDAIYDGLEVDRATLEQQWALWNTVWKAENSLPLKHCLGNHDVWGWNNKSSTTGSEPGWGKGYSLDQLGLDKSYYRFDHGGWEFVVLDSVTPDAETVYRADLGQQQFDWLAGVLAGLPAEKPIVIVSHIPILTVGDVGWSRQLAEQPQGHKMLVHQDRGELLQLFRQYPNVKLCLSGHTHLTEQIRFAGVGFVNSGAVSGLWWKGKNAHTDEGYGMIDLFDDGSFETQYLSYGWDAAKR